MGHTKKVSPEPGNGRRNDKASRGEVLNNQVIELTEGVLSLRLTIEGCRGLREGEEERIQEAMLDCMNEVGQELLRGLAVSMVYAPLEASP